MERDGHLKTAPDGKDRRSTLVTMTRSGRRVWTDEARPKIDAYYGKALDGFSMEDVTHTLHYLLKLLDNMKRLDEDSGADGAAGPRGADRAE
jgi:DNA-binding MarR family transcriptional regulator